MPIGKLAELYFIGALTCALLFVQDVVVVEGETKLEEIDFRSLRRSDLLTPLAGSFISPDSEQINHRWTGSAERHHLSPLMQLTSTFSTAFHLARWCCNSYS
ncbi:hypothetical protein BV898_13790 [Hypsibius exemplaris]|uniref:Uncharacterized protein n=1 Tax=Hypsibius exemplaris TaxID=2072580 RepID=A0A1W0W9S7_HYPEX|nr:hypothetical protein BV898_13790 [Hypsibius exemplaris]